MAAVAVYVLVAVGLTICELCGNVHGLQTVLFASSVIDSAVAVPPVIFHEIVAEAPAVMVAGVAVRFSVNGTVTVTVLGADVPPGPVAVSV
jgi:hypothetical protein